MRKTKKFVAARALLRQLSVSSAGNHHELYGALVRRGYVWDPLMGRDGGWYRTSERSPATPAAPPAKTATPPEPCTHEKRPARCEACSTLEARVYNLEQWAAELARQLAELQPGRPLISGLDMQRGAE